MEFAKALSELLTLNWRNAFALCVTGVSVLVLLRTGYLKDGNELAIGGVALFGFWTLVALVAEQAYAGLVEVAHSHKLKREQVTIAAEKEKAAHEAAEEARTRIISNLDHLRDQETRSLAWIYHRHNGRTRAYFGNSTIQTLLSLGLLVREDDDRRSLDTERIFLIPEYVMAVLKQRLGSRKPDYDDVHPPWVRTRV